VIEEVVCIKPVAVEVEAGAHSKEWAEAARFAALAVVVPQAAAEVAVSVPAVDTMVAAGIVVVAVVVVVAAGGDGKMHAGLICMTSIAYTRRRK
jgi:hypothetical protein